MKTELNLIGLCININLKSKVEVATPGWQREVRIGGSNFEKTLLNICILIQHTNKSTEIYSKIEKYELDIDLTKYWCNTYNQDKYDIRT